MWNIDLKFWGAVVAAIVLKILLSEKHSVRRHAFTIGSAVFLAWSSTEIVIDYLELDYETYASAVAGLLALTGEAVIRWIATLTPKDGIDLWTRGRK